MLTQPSIVLTIKKLLSVVLGICVASLMAACGGGQDDSAAHHLSDSSEPGANKSGLVEITISGLGTDDPQSKATVLTAGGLSTKSVANPTSVSGGFDFRRVSTSTVDVGTRSNGGRRIIAATFEVRNAAFCTDRGNCAPWLVERNNVTFIAAATTNTISGSPLSRLDVFSGAPANPAIALEMKPAHGMSTVGDRVEPRLASFQVFREEELPEKDPAATFLLPYGFVVNNVDETSRTLAADPAPGQFDGLVTIAFSLPLQATAAEDPFVLSMLFQFTEDSNTRVTQALEEKSAAGDLAALARAQQLGTTDIVTLGCDRLPTEILAETLCTVRLTGPENAPTSFIVQTDQAGFQLQTDLSDEFNGVELDRSKWCTRFVFGGLPGEEDRNVIQTGFEDSFCTRFTMFGGGRGDVVNDEQQRYRDVDPNGNLMHQVDGGTLKLRASETLPDPFPNQQPGGFTNPLVNDGTVKYESAMISSKASFKPEDAYTTYIVKARVRLPDVLGTFPAVWLYPEIDANGSQWPPEIDVMEGALNGVEDINTQLSQSAKLIPLNGIPPTQTVTGLRERTFVNNELVNPYSAQFAGELPGYETQFNRWISPVSLRERFLEVGAQWTTTGVCFFIDNVKTVCENYQWVTHQNMSANPAVLIVNMAVGGSFAGRNGVADASLPVATEIDWIRTWKFTQPI